MSDGEDGGVRRGTRRNRGRPVARKSEGPGARTAPTLSRLIATRVLERVERTHAYADLALHGALASSALTAADRALTTELVYGTLRWRGRIDFYLSQIVNQKLESLEPLVASILRLGAYQLLFSDRIPARAAVDQAVRCARATGSERASGLVNAVLRRLSREWQEIALPRLEDDPLAHLVHTLSLPTWVAKRFLDLYGAQEAAALAAALNQTPPLTVRCNRLRITREALLERLRPSFPDAAPRPLAPDAINLGHSGDPGRDSAFLEGLYTVQDEASQLIVELLDPQPGERILDTCAAPGTKTTAIAERLGDEGGVLALDRNARRLGLVARAARRLSLTGIHTHQRDATRSLEDLPIPAGWDATSPLSFDRILVDVPCSGLGALRRNPDARWRLREQDCRQLAAVQSDILARASAVLRPGGCLVYSTCTLLPEENEEVVSRFLQDHPDFRLVPPSELPDRLAPVLDEDGTLRTTPHQHDCDGFYAARLERRA